MVQLEKRIIDLSYKHKLSHIGSCLTALPVIFDIYSKMNLECDRFVLSSGHAGLALYVVLEHFGLADAEKLIHESGTHPDRLAHPAIHCSTGSLGQGLPIAVGMAIADKGKVYCLISDGEVAEGSIYEACNFVRRHKFTNLFIYCNYNGYTAYDKTMDLLYLPEINYIDNSQHWFIKKYKLEAHYRVMTTKDYEEALRRFTL